MEKYHGIDSLGDFPRRGKHPSSFPASSDRVAEQRQTMAKITALKVAVLKLSLHEASTNSSI